MAVQVQLPPTVPIDNDKAHSAALQLLTLEAEVRRQPSETELVFHLANAVQDLIPYGQALVWQRSHNRGALQLRVVSGLPVADRNTPLALELGDLLRERQSAGTLGKLTTFEIPKAQAPQTLLAEFPLRHGLWMPLDGPPGKPRTGCLFLRATPFTPRDQALLQRLADTYAHALRGFGPKRALLDRLPWSKKALAITLVALAVIAMIPVRLSVMAPVEVVAYQPYVLTAPINGVIKSILVAPNAEVTSNQALVQFEDIQPRNEMVLAQQQLAVAQAKDSRTSAAAFNDAQAAHDMAIAAAEHDLAQVSYNYALEVLQRTLIRSPISGLAVYSDRRDWEGRSVQVGEEILQVADPAKIAYRVDLATGNAIELAQGNPVSIYLESSPLGGHKAALQSISYTPRSTPGGLTSYTLRAMPADAEAGAATPRIGARGTARVYGEYAPLALQILRRPLSAVRQFLGV